MGNICGGPQREKDLESFPPHNTKGVKSGKNVSDPPLFLPTNVKSNCHIDSFLEKLKPRWHLEVITPC
jgi:hypothetical protein